MSEMIYAAKMPGRRGYYAVHSADIDCISDAAKFVKQHRRRGNVVELVPVKVGLDGLTEWSDENKQLAAAKDALPLFAGKP